jgi:4-hydroxyphenylpyruvate dioxygenase
MVELNSINEPAEGKKKSQIEEYLDFMVDLNTAYFIATDDIIKTVSQLKARGVEFCLPSSYLLSSDSNDWEIT